MSFLFQGNDKKKSTLNGHSTPAVSMLLQHLSFLLEDFRQRHFWQKFLSGFYQVQNIKIAISSNFRDFQSNMSFSIFQYKREKITLGAHKNCTANIDQRIRIMAEIIKVSNLSFFLSCNVLMSCYCCELLWIQL